MPLGPAIAMIDKGALIVAADQPGLDQFGDGPAEIGLAGTAHPLANFILDQSLGSGMVLGQATIAFELFADPQGEGVPLGIAAPHRGEGIAQPVAQEHRGPVAFDDGPGAAVRACQFGDEAQDHEGIARPRAGVCQLVEQGRQSCSLAALAIMDGRKKHNRMK